ncbi:MAG: hypothetical protein OCU22_09935, partial [Canidatus Methanoxibalbensis ujae]|nr:hypothetical protein [Candidatus Methanoxibalbensis ujae]
PLEQHITARWNRRSRKWNKGFQGMEQANLAPYHRPLLHFFSSLDNYCFLPKHGGWKREGIEGKTSSGIC